MPAYATIITFDDTQLNLLLYSSSGPVGVAVRRRAQTDLLSLARATLSNPWPGGRGPFPPPGPPYLRTGELRDSLEVVDVPGSGPGRGPETDVVATAVHRGWNYGEILRDRGYQFLPPEFYL